MLSPPPSPSLSPSPSSSSSLPLNANNSDSDSITFHENILVNKNSSQSQSLVVEDHDDNDDDQMSFYSFNGEDMITTSSIDNADNESLNATTTTTTTTAVMDPLIIARNMKKPHAPNPSLASNASTSSSSNKTIAETTNNSPSRHDFKPQGNPTTCTLDDSDRRKVLRALASLQNAAAISANPADPEPHFRLAKFVLDYRACLPKDMRTCLVRDALAAVSKLAGGVELVKKDDGDCQSSYSAVHERVPFCERYAPALLLAANLLIAGLPSLSSSSTTPTTSSHTPRYEEAFSLYLRAADADSADAAHNAALLLEHGRVRLSPTKLPNGKVRSAKRVSAHAAVKLHMAAAAKGHPGSLLRMHEIRLEEARDLYVRSLATFASPANSDDEGANHHSQFLHPSQAVTKKTSSSRSRSNSPSSSTTLTTSSSSSASRATLRRTAELKALESLQLLEKAAKHATDVFPEPLFVLASLLMDPARHDAARSHPLFGFVPVDVGRSRELMRKAAGLGHAGALEFLGGRC
ncbi:hypothetical protein HDU97_007777 [Phlyctochytrium planicorne]|nr:hypothetical protein HDU97_007777 [Phlyctochytrium planicorne]